MKRNEIGHVHWTNWIKFRLLPPCPSRFFCKKRRRNLCHTWKVAQVLQEPAPIRCIGCLSFTDPTVIDLQGTWSTRRRINIVMQFFGQNFCWFGLFREFSKTGSNLNILGPSHWIQLSALGHKQWSQILSPRRVHLASKLSIQARHYQSHFSYRHYVFHECPRPCHWLSDGSWFPIHLRRPGLQASRTGPAQPCVDRCLVGRLRSLLIPRPHRWNSTHDVPKRITRRNKTNSPRRHP